jgi:hypothetical protein
MTFLHFLPRLSFTLPPDAGANTDQSEATRAVTHFEIIFVIVLQLLLFVAYFSWCQLPEAAYFSPFIAPEVFKNGRLIAAILINLLLGSFFFRRLTWVAIDPTYGTRIFILVVAITIMWQFATYDYNFYYDQAHYVDRILLIVMALLIYWHPLFAPLFTIFAIVVGSQLHYPLPEAAWLWADKKILVDALILFNAFLFLAVFRQPSGNTFLYLTLCLTGAMYFEAAIAKLSLGPTYYSWLVHNKLSNLLVSSYLQGWLGFLDSSQVIRLAQYVSMINFPMALGTLLIEASGLFILWSRNASRLVLGGAILLHIAIAVSSGIFFWMWCAYDLALIIFVLRSQRMSNTRIYNPRLYVLSVAVILMSPFYFRPIDFAWFDTKLSNFFTIDATGESGKVYRLDAHFFAPYDITLAQSRLFYLTKEKVLVGTYGTSLSHHVTQLLENSSPSEIPSLKERYGADFYNEGLGAMFAVFLGRYVENAVKKGSKFIAINKIAPPYHFGSFAVKERYDFQERLRTLHVYYEEHLFTEREIMPLQKRLLMELALDSRSRQD